MKPRNKFQKQVFEMSAKLPAISQTQIDWAYQNCIEHHGRRTTKGVITCLECGHSWQGQGELIDTLLECVCPACSAKLKVETTRKRIFKQTEYFCVITTYKGFQVLRFFYIDWCAKVGEKTQYFHSEVTQRWITPDGRFATLAKLRPMSYFTDTWYFCSNLEIRPEKPLYNIMPTCVYPRQNVIPELKRAGYKKQIDKLTPFDLFHVLLTENKAETFLKAGETELLRHFTRRNFRDMDKYWASIRICLRNNYNIENVSDWCDYIDLLRFFNKDLHNAKHVCPKDLKTEHDRYMEKKRKYDEWKLKEENRSKALEEEMAFKELKSKFFGIQFTDGIISVRVLDSVEEIMKEGDVLHHCVFANDYHLKPDTLILSACVEGKRVETVEVSLSKLQVLQSRGVCNKNTEYHDQILKLVEKNIPQIRERMAA